MLTWWQTAALCGLTYILGMLTLALALVAVGDQPEPPPPGDGIIEMGQPTERADGANHDRTQHLHTVV